MFGSHAEAITNTAAALYSLGRQDEAEQTWLNVVKLHPDYLEAAEHLVGLMYKKRSNEAIEVVNYIQRALRLPGSEPSSANPFVVCTSSVTVISRHSIPSILNLITFRYQHTPTTADGHPMVSAQVDMPYREARMGGSWHSFMPKAPCCIA